jgi:hypothetical protein
MGWKKREAVVLRRAVTESLLCSEWSESQALLSLMVCAYATMRLSREQRSILLDSDILLGWRTECKLAQRGVGPCRRIGGLSRWRGRSCTFSVKRCEYVNMGWS